MLEKGADGKLSHACTVHMSKKHALIYPLIQFVPITPTCETEGVSKYSYLTTLGGLNTGTGYMFCHIRCLTVDGVTKFAFNDSIMYGLSIYNKVLPHIRYT